MVKIFAEDVRHYAEEYAGKIDVEGIKQRLYSLLPLVDSSKHHKDYIKLLIQLIDTGLLIALPSRFDTLCKQFSALKASMTKPFGSKPRAFYKLIIQALDYDSARYFYRDYVPLMGIKTCVYCNAQYAVTFVSKGGRDYAQFEVDHWKPKNKYPFLCISFYNFVPSCPSCNKHKGENELQYSLYSEVPKVIGGTEYNPFEFRVSDGSLSRFLNSYQANILRLEFRSRTGDAAMEQDYARFGINEMYECFKDEAALCIQRYLFYSDAYRKQLQNNYGLVFANNLHYDEFIYGIPFGLKNTLHRPLSKMIQDIRSQLETSDEYFDWLKRNGWV